MIYRLTNFFRHFSYGVLLLSMSFCLVVASEKKGSLIGEDDSNPINYSSPINPDFDSNTNASAPPLITENSQKSNSWCCFSWCTKSSSELSLPLYATELSSGQSVQGIPMTVLGAEDITVLDREPTEIQKEWRNLCESLSHCGARVLGCFTGTIGCVEGAIDGCGKLKNCCKQPDNSHYTSYGNSRTSYCDRLVSYSQWSRHKCAVFMTAVVFYAIPIALIVGGSVMVNEGLNHGARTITYTATCHDEHHHAYSCTKTACEGASPHYCYVYEWGEALTTLGCLGFVVVTCGLVKATTGGR